MNTQRRETLVRRLEEIIDGANDTTRSMEDGADCLEIFWRLQVLRAALDQAKTELVEEYLERWATALIQENNLDQCRDLIKEFPILFEFAGRKTPAVTNYTRRKK